MRSIAVDTVGAVWVSKKTRWVWGHKQGEGWEDPNSSSEGGWWGEGNVCDQHLAAGPGLSMMIYLGAYGRKRGVEDGMFILATLSPRCL